MKRPTSSLSDASGPRAVFGFLPWAAALSLPLLLALGCQGELEGNFPAQSSGSGGSSSGSGGSGSGGSGSGSGGSSGGCDAPAMLFMAKGCDVGGCHASGMFDTPPNLTVANLGAMLKSQNATTGPCKDQKLVDPATPKNSALYKRIEGTACGPQMPFGVPLEGDQLSSALSCLSDWISKL